MSTVITAEEAGRALLVISFEPKYGPLADRPNEWKLLYTSLRRAMMTSNVDIEDVMHEIRNNL